MRKLLDKSFSSQNLYGGRARRVVAYALLFLLGLTGANAEGLSLQSLDFTTLPGDSLQVQLTLSGPAFSPRVFHTDNPARIALDLPGVANTLEKKQVPINVNGAESIQAISTADRTRVVINLSQMTQYTTRVEGNNIYVVLLKGMGSAPVAESFGAISPPMRSQSKTALGRYSGGFGGGGIQNIDFRRGEKGVGRILVSLSNPKMVPDIREEGRRVIATFPNSSLPPTLARRLDVMDFATPVQFIDSLEDGNAAKLVITPATDEFDFSSYQTENLLTIEFRPLTKAEREDVKKKAFAYSGEKLSLNFQDIPVRSVLQILGDFTNLNIVASDTVQGNVTLRLNDVPWDQALELVLKAKGLGKRQQGNIIEVLPMDELNRQTKDDLEALKTVEELEPLKTEIIQINYTDARAIKDTLLSTAGRTSQITNEQQNITPTQIASTTLETSQSILSGRGNITVDERTNQLIVKDTPRSLERIRDLVGKLDIPVRQVMIESRIVIANNDFARELGSRFAVNQALNLNNRPATADPYAQNPPTNTLTPSVPNNGFFTSGNALSSLPATGTIAGPPGVLGVTVLKVGDYLLDLELSAAQAEGRGEIVSNPRVLTADQTKAIIKQGTQIPYQATVAVGGAGATAISFKDAVLELDVTPHITPNDEVRMLLVIKKDSPGQQYGANVAIDKKEINTTAQVANGDTVVLGGIFEGTKTTTTNKVPFMGDLPGIGFMFRRNQMVDTKKELLIFITPKILRENLGQR